MPLIKGTKYEEIYDKFAKCITDYNLFELLQSDDAESQKFVENMLEGFLMSSVAKFYKCTKDLSNRDEILKQFNFVLDDLEIEILALMMVAEWVEPQLNSTSYTLQFIGGTNTKLREFCSLSQFAVFGNIAVYSFVYAGKSLET